MANIETKVTEGFDNEGRVVISCEVWETDETENYGEVVYYSYQDEFSVVFGIVTQEMFDAAVNAIKSEGV